jgi:hypothetical protein
VISVRYAYRSGYLAFWAMVNRIPSCSSTVRRGGRCSCS